MTKRLYTVQFSDGSAQLSSDAKSGIQAAIMQMATNQVSIILDAYADSSGDPGVNMALTVVRAQAVLDYMLALKYPPDRIQLRARGERVFETPGFPDTPKSSRRVEILAMT